MPSMAAIGTIFTSVQKTVKTSSGSAVNIVICLVTVGSEQLFSFAAFQCPCPANFTTPRGFQQNYLYGWVFIIVPALALFVLGYGMNVKTWKLITGCIYRSARASRGYVAGCSTLIEICMQALVAPMAWMSVAFLDGKYYACAASTSPYENSCKVVATSLKYIYSEEFIRNKQTSQIIGWILVAVTLFFGSIFYMFHRCMSPLTYHHRKYARWYRELETEAFEKKARDQIKKEVEDETVERFLQDKRDKYDWDKISTVFNSTRDKDNYALYSRLDEWNEDNKTKYPLREVAVEVRAEDDSSIEEPNNKKNNYNSNGRSVQQTTEQITGNEVHPSSVSESTAMDQSEEPLLPKIPPPPALKNAKKRRPPSSGLVQCDSTDAASVNDVEPNHRQIESMMSQEQPKDMTSQLQPINGTIASKHQSCKPAILEPPRSFTSQSPRKLGIRSSLCDNDETINAIAMNDLRYCKSMSNVLDQTTDIRHNADNSVRCAKSQNSSVYDNATSPTSEC